MSVTRREYLLVDGHSVIFAWPELRALHAGPRRELARTELTKLLTAYQDHSGVRVVVVFDGRGPGRRAAEVTEPGGVQIFYSPTGKTADEFIERLVAKYAAVHRLVVVTGDRMVQQTAITFGAESCLSVEELRADLTRLEKENVQALAAHRRRVNRETGGLPFPPSGNGVRAGS